MDNFQIAPSSGTSIAAPFIAGGAGLLRRWMNAAFGFTVEPGAVNAMLIASGENRAGAVLNNLIGAGNLALPLNAGLSSGKVSVPDGQTIEVSVNVGAGSIIDAAIWWPETEVLHNDVDLQLKTPAGAVPSRSQSAGSIWEKVSVNSATTGVWKLRIIGFAVTGAQPVYWALIRR